MVIWTGSLLIFVRTLTGIPAPVTELISHLPVVVHCAIRAPIRSKTTYRLVDKLRWGTYSLTLFNVYTFYINNYTLYQKTSISLLMILAIHIRALVAAKYDVSFTPIMDTGRAQPG